MSGFVLDGESRLLRSPEYLTALAMIEVEVNAEYDPLIEHARWFRRWRLQRQRDRRIRQLSDAEERRLLSGQSMQVHW